MARNPKKVTDLEKSYKFEDKVENTNSLGKKIVIGATVLGMTASTAFASSATLTAPTFALDDVAVVAGALLTGLAGLWAIRRGIALAK